MTTPLPWTHLSPASSTDEPRAVDHDRDPRHLGLGRDHVQERRHRLLRVEQVGVHVHVEEVGAAAHLLERDLDGARVVVRLDQRAEARRAGDVRPLADHHEARVRADLERLEAAEARARARRFGTCRGVRPLVTSAMALTCSGVVPQQPPTMFTSPSRANSPRKRLVSAGCSSCAPNSFGRPAFGWHGGVGRRDRARGPATNGRICAAPSEQLTPTISGSACSTESQERLDRLPGEVAAAEVDRREREPQREVGRRLPRGDDRRLGVQRVEDRLDQEQVDAALGERADLLGVRARAPGRSVADAEAGSSTFGESESATFSGPTEPATKPPRLVGGLARKPRAGEVHLVDGVLERVVGLADRGRREGVRGRDVRAGRRSRRGGSRRRPPAWSG